MIETALWQFAKADANIQTIFGGANPRVFVGAIPVNTARPCASIECVSRTNPFLHNCRTHRVQVSTHDVNKYKAEYAGQAIKNIFFRLYGQIGSPAVNIAKIWIDNDITMITEQGYVNIVDYMIMIRE